MGLSNLGIFHTVVGLIAIGAALISFIKHGKISLAELSGKIYVYGTIITTLTSLGLSRLGGLNPGHILSLLILILVSIGYLLYAKKKGNNRSRYFENFCLSFSYFLSWLPTIAETFQRVPIGNPLAKDSADPIIARTLLVIFVFFIIGSFYQFRKQKKINISEKMRFTNSRFKYINKYLRF